MLTAVGFCSHALQYLMQEQYPSLNNLSDGLAGISLHHQKNAHFCPLSYHDSLKSYFMHPQILFSKSLTTFQKGNFRSCSVYKGSGFTPVPISGTGIQWCLLYTEMNTETLRPRGHKMSDKVPTHESNLL